MKKIYFLLMLISAFGYSQVGIGTTTPNGALDINSATNGVVVPNVALTSRALAAPVVNPNGGGLPLNGTLVWNTATAGSSPNNVVPGFYFWDSTSTSWIAIAGDGGKNWTTTGNTGTTAGTNYIGTNDVQDFVVKTSAVVNTPVEKMRVTTAGNVGINAPAPTATALLTINPNTNAIRSGIDMTMTNATATATGLNISAGNAFVNGISVNNSTTSTSASVFGIGSVLSATNIVSGYNAYRNGTGLSYGLYGVSGTNALYNETNTATYAGFLQGRAVISSESSPSSALGTDLEVRNTTTGAAAPATVSLRQTTALATTGNVLADLNFGDNYVTTPQARIRVLRDAAASSTSDMPTAMTFSTTSDAGATLTERMRIDNTGKVGVGTTAPTTLVDVNGALSLREGTALSFVNGANTQSLATNPSSVYRITGPTSAFSLTTLTPVSLANGQIVTLINSTSQDFTIVNNSGSTINSVFCPGATDLTLSGISSTVTLMYNSTSTRWMVIGSTDNPYGRNLKSSKGSSDITTTSTSFADMSDMTITFTPKHNTVYINFSASGDIDVSSGFPQAFVKFRVLKDGVLVGGTVSLGTDLDYDDVAGTTIVSAWNAHFTMYPVTVTSGTATTIKIQWMRDGIGLGTRAARNRVTTNSDYSHRSLNIYD
ncbi:hypothetical protein [Flavobacterium sp.]|uniref:hypothetical protein n=1 Tax=Flavobacterium sp. TaxID=239 RepID=UPI00286D03EE|nr:hypothetical protein [Flavobacterium sp.]